MWTPGTERNVYLGENRVVKNAGIATDFNDEGYIETNAKHFSAVSSFCGFFIAGGDRTYLIADGVRTILSTRSGGSGWNINFSGAIDDPEGGLQGNLTRVQFVLQGKATYNGAYAIQGFTASLIGFAWTGSRWKTWLFGVPLDDIATTTLSTNTANLGFGGLNGSTIYDWIHTCHAALLVDTDLGTEFQRAVSENPWQFFE